MKDFSLSFIFRRLSTILAVATLTLTLIAASSGILLAFYYEPAAGGAYDSLKAIDTDVPYGWLIHTMHNLSGNGVIGVALIQIVVMFLSERFRPSWLTAWVSGILFTLSAIGLAWTAMLLGWDQLGFWRLKIELGTIEAIPLIGTQLKDALTGGGAIGTVSVEHLYAIHSYIVSIAAVGLAVIHLGSLMVQEREMQAEALTAFAQKAVSEDEEEVRASAEIL
ncbi:cytochrome bc complex cytochrome b subunit [Phormidesmis priestleyi ULC007]|uniref:Cytochrome bc complex cytochrome b subunit n=1 Tax=Phormidesmis priestleyi ULC007 TaxID=1920490 RepID=A0A2T1DHB3_9CYAN|nr:cytochrome b N-terminal domain-containing protein [Phormidesmis priestleyi]PSB19868.1 cytochrome bc complex cytochrome b subunit [Phormidesmis priestleyi ULC007]PZO49195.1 MAG: cytochrome bc complex cytochrome b subunit [Phormidesmis priestleyi]